MQEEDTARILNPSSLPGVEMAGVLASSSRETASSAASPRKDAEEEPVMTKMEFKSWVAIGE